MIYLHASKTHSFTQLKSSIRLLTNYNQDDKIRYVTIMFHYAFSIAEIIYKEFFLNILMRQ